MQAFWQQWCLHQQRMFYSEDEEAQQRSLRLLQDWLSEDQLHQYEKEGWFLVIGNNTGTVYKVGPEQWFSIAVWNENEDKITGEKYCVVPRGCDAVGDRMLAQKIWLETDEITTLRTANLTGIEYKNSVLGKYD
jgi:hypothetical protein